MFAEKDILSLARIQILVICLFAAFKMLRPTVLKTTDNGIIRTIFLSFPNLAEGIIGVLTTIMVILILFRKGLKVLYPSNSVLYIFAAALATIYVLLQEFKVHNLGGNNVYDPNDVLFSLIGLSIGFLILCVLKPAIGLKTTENIWKKKLR